MKQFVFCLLLLSISMTTFAQKYFTKEGKVSFYSEAPMEKIEAHNQRVTAVIDTETGAVEVALLIKSFQFEKALMQEHFNENYMESSKYPKALFKGAISNLDEVDFSTNGTYNAKVAGDLTIHGVKNAITIPTTIKVSDGRISGEADFVLACSDYDISIPKVVAENIAKEIEVNMTADFQPLTK